MIAEKKEIKLSSSNFRYAKNQILNIDIFEISIFIENIDISHQPTFEHRSLAGMLIVAYLGKTCVLFFKTKHHKTK